MIRNPIKKALGIIQLLCAAMIITVLIFYVISAVDQSVPPVYTFVPKDNKNNPAPVSSVRTGLNINTASKDELMELPGIGDVIAQAIIDSREKEGIFHYIEDLLMVQGIGAKTLANIRSLIYIP